MKGFKASFLPRFLLWGVGLSAVLVILWQQVPLGAAGQENWLDKAERKPFDLSGSFAGLDGKKVQLTELKDKVIFLNFWATWCGPCRLEMPSMSRLQEKYSAQGLMVVAVSDEDVDSIKSFLKKTDYPFLFVSDPDWTLMDRLRTNILPTSLILDKEGNVAFAHIGAAQWDSPELQKRFQELMAE